MKQIALFACFLLSNYALSAQATDSERSYFNWFDNLTDAQNSHLSNGIAYYDEYVTKKGHHQYYLTPDFLTGTITYDGQRYFDVLLQYNLYSDQLILRFYKNDNLRTIQLIKDKVERFTVNNTQFTHVREGKDAGFYEILFEEGVIGLYKKHYKSRQRHVNSAGTYYSFKEKSYLIVRRDDSYFQVNNRSSLLRIFPEHEETINSYYSKRGTFYNANQDGFMKSLLQKISNE